MVNRVVLGDNPFFAISHLDSSKSEAYLLDNERYLKASEIIRGCVSLGIKDFMISCHLEANDLLTSTGYGAGYQSNLPDLCIVVPNVHEFNKSVAEGGLVSAIGNLLRNFRFGKKGIIRFLTGLDYFGNTKYLALHNVVTDLLVGLGSARALNAFHYLCKMIGLKSVFITLNPVKLKRLNVKCDVVCTYYNSLGYNVCYDVSELHDLKDSIVTNTEWWAMGVVASGAIKNPAELVDKNLEQFDGALVASTKFERVSGLAQVLRDE